MIGFIFGCFLGAGLTLIVVGCFAVERTEDAYSVGYSNGFIDGADATAEKQIAEGVCA